MNMFNRFKLFIFAIVALCFCGCTLMMDDFDLPEEERGKEEPYTEVTPAGNITYKYDEKTTPLNGRAQEYIAMYNDSVLYLMDNIPSEWIPKVSGYVSANCSQKTPLGINGRVTSVTRENGLIRVDLAPAARDEVFDVFKAEIDFSFTMPPMEIYDSLGYAENGMMPNDSTYIDMNFWERLDTTVTTKADTPKQETFAMNFSHTFNNFSGKLAKLNGTFIQVEIKSIEHKNMHYYEDINTEDKEEWTDTYSERSYRAVFGYGTSVGSVRENFLKNRTTPNTMSDYKNLFKSGKTPLQLTESEEYKKLWKEKKKKSFAARTIVIPITGTVLSFVLDFDADVYFDVSGYLDMTYTEKTAKRRTGYEVKDGKYRKIDKELVAAATEKTDYNITGAFDLYARVRAGMGVLVGTFAGGGAVVGLEVKAGVRAEYTLLDRPGPDGFTVIDNDQCRIIPYLSCGGYGKGLASFCGITFDVADFNFATSTLDFPIYLNTRVKDHTATYKFVTDPNTGKRVPEFKSVYSFGYLGEWDEFHNLGCLPEDRRACLRVYSGSLDGNYVTIYGEDSEIKARKDYEFIVNSSKEGVNEAEEYIIVPCVYDKKTMLMMELRSKRVTIGDARPQIYDVKYTQWYGQEMSEADFEELKKANPLLKYYKHTDFADYSFVTRLSLKNVLRMKRWGINYKIYGKNKHNVIADKDVYINNGDKRIEAGKYTVIATFFSNHKPTNDDDQFSIRVCPFYEYEEGGELERVDGPSKGPYSLRYPYMGDIKISGTTEYVKLN